MNSIPESLNAALQVLLATCIPFLAIVVTQGIMGHDLDTLYWLVPPICQFSTMFVIAAYMHFRALANATADWATALHLSVDPASRIEVPLCPQEI